MTLDHENPHYAVREGWAKNAPVTIPLGLNFLIL